MPIAVFTSSSGGDIGGGLTYRGFREKGPMLVGQIPEPPASGSQTGTQPGGATGFNGSAAIPMYSFVNRPDLGIYPFSVTTSAGGVAEMRMVAAALDITSHSTAGLAIVSSGSTGTVGFGSTSATNPFLMITQTTATMAAGTAAPTNPVLGALLSWDSANKTLEVFSTVTGAWMRLHSSSGVNIVFSSS